MMGLSNAAHRNCQILYVQIHSGMLCALRNIHNCDTSQWAMSECVASLWSKRLWFIMHFCESNYEVT